MTTRDKLIEGMRDSLRARGYGSTSMKDLLATTGVSSGSMYHSFPGGKDELAATAIREAGFKGAAQIRSVFEKTQRVAAGIEFIFRALIDELEGSDFANGCPIGVPATEAVGISPRIQEASRSVFDAWVEAYRDALIGEGWSSSDANAFATLIVASYEGSLTLARAMRRVAPIEDAMNHLVARSDGL
ncbi:MAG: TetR/AcrR family transcriptional regulator [Myxococcota bacterium]